MQKEKKLIQYAICGTSIKGITAQRNAGTKYTKFTFDIVDPAILKPEVK